jgi:hypothetical protein
MKLEATGSTTTPADETPASSSRVGLGYEDVSKNPVVQQRWLRG